MRTMLGTPSALRPIAHSPMGLMGDRSAGTWEAMGVDVPMNMLVEILIILLIDTWMVNGSRRMSHGRERGPARVLAGAPFLTMVHEPCH